MKSKSEIAVIDPRVTDRDLGHILLIVASIVALAAVVDALPALAIFVGGVFGLYYLQHRFSSLCIPPIVLVLVVTAAWFAFRKFDGLDADMPVFDYSFSLQFVGISYLYLRAMSLLMSEDKPKPAQALSYLVFFPTFPTGPTAQASEFTTQTPSLRIDGFLIGFARIALGGAKMMASTGLGVTLPYVSLPDPSAYILSMSVSGVWLSVCLTGVWLYLNFSGASDVAIGVARVLGLRVPENFANPFAATDITAFWQRWHITLGNFLRVFIFNPLVRRFQSMGCSEMMVLVLPPLLTMIAAGIWHRPHLHFILWGVLHGMALVCHQLWRRFVRPSLPPALCEHWGYKFGSWFITFVTVNIGWVLFFPINHSADRAQILARMFGLS